MSLFPAYAKKGEEEKSTLLFDKNNDGNTGISNDSEKPSWLDNASFSIKLGVGLPIALPVSQIPLPESSKEPGLLQKSQLIVPEAGRSSERNESSSITNRPEISLELVPPAEKRAAEAGVDEDLPSLQATDGACQHKKGKNKKRKSDDHDHKRSKKPHYYDIPVVKKDYYICKKKERGYLKVLTLAAPVVPFYRACRYVLGQNPEFWTCSKKKNFKSKKRKSNVFKEDRYYKYTLADIENASSSIGPSTDNDASPEISEEKSLLKQTETFNKTLGKEPHNVAVWLQYVQFQDTVWEFERAYRRGGGIQGNRVTAERKLSIIDKALSLNPDSELLLSERGRIAEVIYPADELSQQFEKQLERNPKSMSLWRNYIGAIQCALSLCTVVKVTELYGKGMMCFHQARRGVPMALTKPAEENILDFLLESGLFLRQTGLQEQMWMLLQHSLELNLTQPNPDHFKIRSTISEEKVVEMEESVLSSDLPLPELWLRVERLRESVHFLPWDSDQACDDPQRLVFAEDVSDLLQPITTPELSYRLASIVLSLLKVPALPCRDTALRSCGLTRIPWAMDSIEILLAALFPFGTVDCTAPQLSQLTELVVGPSYLFYVGQDHNLGQVQYLEFVTKVFHACGDCLKEPAKTAWFVWWLRFERFLIVLVRKKLSKFLSNRRKIVKASIKEFLKRDLNRNNLLFYREYALIEKEFGNHESACNILKTALSTQHSGEPVIGITNEEDRARLCCLYRTLCELFLTRDSPIVDSRDKAVNLLVALSLGNSPQNLETKASPIDKKSALVKFGHITGELCSDPRYIDGRETQAFGMEHLLPDFFVDWVSCHCWLLFLTNPIAKVVVQMEDMLKKLAPRSQDVNNNLVTEICCRREALFESYISILSQHCQETIGGSSLLLGVVRRALQEFPNNVNFLASAARVQDSESSPWWMLRKVFDESKSQLSKVFLVLLAKHRLTQFETMEISYSDLSVQADGLMVMAGDVSYKNRTSSIFRQLIADPTTRRCPIIWRMYLKFLFECGNYESCRSTFYRAVEECPWVKTLYMDGAKILPGDIQQVQDLIIEKELRLHVTPEELDILRKE